MYCFNYTGIIKAEKLLCVDNPSILSILPASGGRGLATNQLNYVMETLKVNISFVSIASCVNYEK